MPSPLRKAGRRGRPCYALMKWYKEHLKVTIIFAVLLLLISITTASYINRGNNSWLGRKAERLIVFVQEPLNYAGDGVASTVRGVLQHKKIMAENEMLKEENAKLKQEIIKQSLLQEELAELKRLSLLLHYESPSYGFDHVAATVVAMDSSRWDRVFTINEGSKKGIRKDDIVINSEGLVGRIFELGSDWAKVISIIDENNKVSFQVFRDSNLLGIVKGDGKGGLSGYMLDAEVSIIEGDVLITSGMELYPQGIPIGKIKQVKGDDDALLEIISVEPAVNFSAIKKVAVIIKVD